MTEKSLYRRIIRRETHQSRSTASVIVISIVMLGAVYAGIEIVLALLGAAPLLVSPAAAVAAFRTDASWTEFAGAGALLFGVVLVLIAIIPTRRARHGVSHPRMAIVVDDGVLAGALAVQARRAVGVSQDRVRAAVSRKRGVVTITPTSGLPISREDAQHAAESLLETLSTSPTIRARVIVLDRAVVGS